MRVFSLCLLLLACRTTTPMAASPHPRWVRTLEVDTALDQLETLVPEHRRGAAVVLDFPARTISVIDGGPTTWLRWLDARAPKGIVEALGAGRPSSLEVQVGDGPKVMAKVSLHASRTTLPRALFDPSLIEQGEVRALHLRFGSLELGPVDALVGQEAELGADVLRDVVVLAGVEPPRVWLMHAP